MLLTQAEYREFEAPGQLDERRQWDALYRLHDRLNDQFIVVGETGTRTDDRAPPTPVVCLSVFSARDAEETPLYAAVTRAGALTIGRVDDLGGKKVTRRFADIDPLTTQVVALAVTKRFRAWGGDRLDLFVVIRSSEEATAVSAYHGIVGVDGQGSPQLEAARDDGSAARHADDWFRVPAEGLPAWLRRERIAYAQGIDPFDETTGERLRVLDEQPGEVEAVAVGAELTALVSGDELVVFEGTSAESALVLRDTR